MAYLQSPTGTRITGTLESIPGTCPIVENSFTRASNGKFDFMFNGSGTKIDWDGQKTVTRDVETAIGTLDSVRLFVDDDGTAWPEDSLTLIEEDPDGED